MVLDETNYIHWVNLTSSSLVRLPFFIDLKVGQVFKVDQVPNIITWPQPKAIVLVYGPCCRRLVYLYFVVVENCAKL